MEIRADKLARIARRYRVVVWFFVAMFGLDRVIAAHARRWDAYDPHPYQERLTSCRAGQWDVLIVGGSPAMYAIDPAALAGTPWRGRPLETAFNFGLPLGTTTEAWLAAEHGTAAPPRLIVYGATATDFSEDRMVAYGPRLMMTLADVYTAASARPKSAGWYAWNYGNDCVARAWQLYYYRRGIRLSVADLVDRVWPGACPAEAAEAHRGLSSDARVRAGNGFLGFGEVTPADRLDCQKANGLRTDHCAFMDRYRVGAAHLASLNRLLADAARRGVPVLIVDLPVPADLDTRLYPAEFAAYRSALAAAAAAHAVRILHATREAVGLTDADFGDLVHVNGAGAAKLSAWVRAEVAGAGEATP